MRPMDQDQWTVGCLFSETFRFHTVQYFCLVLVEAAQ